MTLQFKLHNFRTKYNNDSNLKNKVIRIFNPDFYKSYNGNSIKTFTTFIKKF